MGENVEAPIVLRDDLVQIINGVFKDENVESASMEVSEASGKGDNYLGKLYRVKASGKHGKSISIIVKCALDAKLIRDNFPVEILYQREIHAYSKMLPILYSLQNECHLPNKEKFYFAKYYDSITEIEKETLFIGDLAVEGYKMYNRQKPFDRQHLELVVKNLARFHATSFVLKQKNPTLFDQFSQKVGRKMEYGDNIGMFMEIAKKKCFDTIESAEIRQRVEANLEDFMGKFDGYLDYKTAEPYNAICHGDCWINNFLFKYEGDKVTDMKFIDWQVVRLASPITDIAYVMFSSTDEQLRSNLYTSSLDLYYNTLDKNINMMGCNTAECYPLEVFKDQIKSTMPFGLISAILLLPTVLCNAEDTLDMDIKPEDVDQSVYENLLSKKSKDRLNGVFRDMVSYGII
ncbi:uncharacterized protein LOC143914723 [Arctopsyche grandis]|uniref:uncharacterized protein LOC143914723 n=1 Tax=Arctopsyche grandis TaxID=121162 RepID=UPI00406D7787